MMALAPDWRWFIPAEFLYGTTFFIIPALNSYALQAIPAQSANQSFERTLTTLYASFPAGLIASQPLGGVLADSYGIRTTFWIGIGLIALATVVMFRLRSYSAPQDSARTGWRALTENRSLMVLLAFFLLVTFSITLGWPLSPIFLHDELEFSLSWVGIFMALNAAGTVVWNLAIGRLRPRWGLTTTLVLVWLSMLMLLQLDGVVPVGVAFIMFGALYTAHHLMNAAVARRVTPSQRGMAFGLSELSFSLASAFTPRIAGALYEMRPRLPFLASFLSIPLIIILNLVLLSMLKRPAATPDSGDPVSSAEQVA
jgi:predicted MFS family arabinose efflux permease